jgi:hypothetical protein
MLPNKPNQDVLFRAHAVGSLMTESTENKPLTAKQIETLNGLQSKDKLTDKQKWDLTDLLAKQDRSKIITLSDTAKSYVEKVWFEKKYGYKKPLVTDEITKGLMCEQDGMSLVQDVLGGEFRMRFGNNIINDYITGTPDIVLKHEDYVEDIKISFTLESFFYSELTPLYYGQGQAYMWLTGKTKFRLIYCLVPTPHYMVTEDIRRFLWKFSNDPDNKDFQKVEEQIEHNNAVINTIPMADRVKVFGFGYDENYINRLKLKITAAREYYNGLALNKKG